MRGLVLLASVIIPGCLTHLSLFGWHRAPVNTVHLSPRQWAIVGLIAAPLLTAIVLVVAGSRRPSVAQDSDWPGVVVLCGFVGLASVACGMAPSLPGDDPDEAGAPPSGTDDDTA
jgi:hypothetical protein